VRPRGGLSLSLSANRGDQIDFANSRLGHQLRIEPTVDWNANRHLLVRLRHTALRLDTQDGRRIFDAQLGDYRLTWQFNVRSFLRFTVQHQHVKRNLEAFIAQDVDGHTLNRGSQLLYSYKVNPQTVFFLGYSDNHIDNDELADWVRTDRTLFVKLAYAWVP
jgi:hypothetical protein